MTNQRRKSGGIKVIMIGDTSTGKSCLLARYTKDEFMEEHKITVGVQFASKKLDIDDNGNQKTKLQIWDTSGQESFRSIVRSFYRNSRAVLLVYDITRKSSFESLQGWLDEARDNAPKNAIFVLMGTHLDLEDQRQVTKEDAEVWMKQQQIAMFFQTSAKTSFNVSKAFDEIAKQLQQKQESRMLSKMENEHHGGSVSLQKQTSGGKKNGGCYC